MSDVLRLDSRKPRTPGTRVLALLTSVALGLIASVAQGGEPMPAAADAARVAVAMGASFGSQRADVYCPGGTADRSHTWLLIPDASGAPLELAEIASRIARRAQVIVPDLRGLDEAGRVRAVDEVLAAFRRLSWSSGETCAPPREQVVCEDPASAFPNCHERDDYSGLWPTVTGVLAFGRGAGTFARAAFRGRCESARNNLADYQTTTLVLVSPDLSGTDDLDPEICSDAIQTVSSLEPDDARCSPEASAAKAQLFDRARVTTYRVRASTRCDFAPPGTASCVAACGAAKGGTAREVFWRYLEVLSNSTEQNATYALAERDRVGGLIDVEEREPSDPDGFGFNASFVVGFGAADHRAEEERGIAIAFRPELILHRPRDTSWGIGPYLELGSMGPGGLLLGAGATLSIPITPSFHLAPSLGTQFARPWNDDRLKPGFTLGGFVGHRMHNSISAFDASFGVRGDYRRSFDGSADALSFGLQLDLTILVAGGAFL